MISRFVFTIALLIAGSIIFTPGQGRSQSRLGLHVTQEELDIWRQRAVVGPYRSAGDVSTNSPGDWARINNNANSFRSNPSAQRWSGQPSGKCWSWRSNPPSLPARNFGEQIRDAAFRYLLLRDNADREAVLKELLAQAATSGTKWADSTRWNTSLDCMYGDTYSWQISMWLRKLLYAYDYIRNDISASNRKTLDTWFTHAAELFQENIHNTVVKRFPNRLKDDYTTLGSSATSCTGPRVTHYKGYTKCGFHEAWSNRSASHVLLFAATGIMVDDDDLQDHGKRWFREWVRFANFADNTSHEFHRWTDSMPTQGWAYASTLIGIMSSLADIYARAGDTSLYEYTTSQGHATANLTPPGGSKNLKNIIIVFLKHVDGSMKRYGTDQASRNGNSNYLIDTVDEVARVERNNDHYVAVSNMYYKDPYIRSVYLRRASGAPPYPSRPSNGGYCVWCGEWGTLPGVLFMFGQMENQASPYPDNTAAAPSPSSSNAVGHWKFDEGSGTVARDSSGKGAHATLMNGATWTTGRSGSAVSFDGRDDFVKIPTGNMSVSQGTFSAWIRARLYKAGTQYIFGHTTLPAYANRMQLYTGEAGGYLNTGMGSSHTSKLKVHQLKVDTWQHVVLTWQSGSFAVYVDGVQRSAGSYSGLASFNSYAHIGGAGVDSDPQSWAGAIDEVKIWNRALSAIEVQNEFKAQLLQPTAPSDLVTQTAP